MPNEKKKPIQKPAAPIDSAAALAAVQSEMAALSPAELATINVDIPQAVAVVLGVLAQLAPFRPQIVKSLPDHPIAGFDNLKTYALAAYHAHILSLPRETSESRVATLLEEAAPLRAALLGDAEALARRGHLDAEAVAAVREGRGNVDTANDLVALAALFTTHWAAGEHKTAATWAEVRRAGELGPLLLAAIGAREHGTPLTPDQAADQRRRAYTLLYKNYGETRRAVAYLRWHEGDADDLAPSLYKGRGGRPAPRTSSAKDEATPDNK